VRWILAPSAHLEAASIIARGGGAIATLIGCMFAAVVGAIVAIEMQRRPFVWAIMCFVAMFMLISAVRAMI
jgi:hypothetical protein